MDHTPYIWKRLGYLFKANIRDCHCTDVLSYRKLVFGCQEMFQFKWNLSQSLFLETDIKTELV